MNRTARQVTHTDSRGRVSLGKFGVPADSTILVERMPGDDTTLILHMGRVLSEVEYQIMSRPENVASLERAGRQVAEGDLVEISEGLELPGLGE